MLKSTKLRCQPYVGSCDRSGWYPATAVGLCGRCAPAPAVKHRGIICTPGIAAPVAAAPVPWVVVAEGAAAAASAAALGPPAAMLLVAVGGGAAG